MDSRITDNSKLDFLITIFDELDHLLRGDSDIDTSICSVVRAIGDALSIPKLCFILLESKVQARSFCTLCVNAETCERRGLMPLLARDLAKRSDRPLLWTEILKIIDVERVAGLSNLMYIPVIARGEAQGALFCKEEDIKNEAQIEFLASACAMLATALRNASLPKIYGSRERALFNLLDRVGEAFYLTDAHTEEVLFISRALREERGIGEDYRGKTCWKTFYEGQSQTCSFCPVSRLASGEADSVTWETHEISADKHFRHISRIIEWLDGRQAHMLRSVDITEVTCAHAALSKAKQEADILGRAKGDFLSRMSHEIRTPINAIIGMTHIAAGTDDIGKVRECAARIDDASRQLLGVVNDLFDVAKHEAGTMVLADEVFDLVGLLAGIISSASIATGQKAQEFFADVGPGVARYYRGDGARLSQAISCLTSNAVKFTPEGGSIRLEIYEKARTDAEATLAVCVTDTGIGIAEPMQEHLFQSFEQADGSAARQFGGTGLGLSIARNIVEKMGGSIGMRSEVGRGSAFYFEVRLGTAGSKPYPSERGAVRDPRLVNRHMSEFIPKPQQKPTGEQKEGTMDSQMMREIKEYIDLEEALGRLRGNMKIFKTLLASYMKSDYKAQLSRDIEAGDMLEASKTAHSIKGVAANLAFKKLYASILNLEQQLKNNMAEPNMVACVYEDMDKTLDCIQRIMQEP